MRSSTPYIWEHLEATGRYGAKQSRYTPVFLSWVSKLLEQSSIRFQNGEPRWQILGFATLGLLKRGGITRSQCQSVATLAWPPPAARAGDVVGVIFGCRTPFTLRKMDEEDCYKVVGPMYVTSSIPNGEDFPVFSTYETEEWAEGEYVERDIILC